MTTANQAADAAEVPADAGAETVSRSELNEAISRRQSALDRARVAEDRLAQLETAQATRERAELESQGKFKELAEESEAKAAALQAEVAASRSRLEKLTGRHREAVDARFGALPDEVREHLAGRLGESPDLDAYEDAVSLAESLRGQTSAPAPRSLGAQPSAGKVAGVQGAGKATAAEVARMTPAEQEQYIKRFYS